MEKLGRLGIQNDEEKKIPSGKRARFKFLHGATIAESLPFGLARIIEVKTITEKESENMEAKRYYLRNLVEWEEALDWVHVVPALPIIEDPRCKLPSAKIGCLKVSKTRSEKYDVSIRRRP